MIKLTDFSLKNVAAVFIIAIMLISGGIYAATTLKIERLPDFSLPYVTISTQYALPPDEIAESITIPLEKAAMGMDGVKSVGSISNENFSIVTVELEQKIDPQAFKKDAESELNSVSLPEGTMPRVSTVSVSTLPVFMISIYSEEMDQQEVGGIFNEILLPELNAVKGMDKVEALGMQQEVLSIRLDGEQLQKLQLTPGQITSMLDSDMAAAPVGALQIDGNEQLVRVAGDIQSIEELKQSKLMTLNEQTITLGSIAQVELVNNSDTISRFNGMPAIGLNLYKTRDTNAVVFADEIEDLLANWEKELPGLTFHTVLNDATDIKQSIHGMLQEGSLGAILASLMILLFLRNFRMTLIVLVSIPLSLIITLLLMAWLNITLNIMTLGGMIIAIGRVVDDSIVVIENIYRLLEKAQERNESVIRMATKQVSSAITSSTLTTVAVFGPIGFVTGIVGEVFRPFALTLVCALLASLLVALTIIPLLAKLMVLRQANITQSHEEKVGKMASVYKGILLWCLGHRLQTLGLTAILFILSVVLITPRLPVSFLPDAEKDKSLKIHIDLPKGTSMEQMNERLLNIEKIMLTEKNEEGEALYTYVDALLGYRDEEVDRFPYKATLYAEYSDGTNATEAIEETKNTIEEMLPEHASVQVLLTASDQEAGGSAANFTYAVSGEDPVKLREAAKMVEEQLKGYSTLSEVKSDSGESKQEILVQVDEERAGQFGLDAAKIMYMVQDWIQEGTIGTIELDSGKFDTLISLASQDKNSIENLGKLVLLSTTGGTAQETTRETSVLLQDVAVIKQMEAPLSITRKNQMQTIFVSATIEGKDKAGISNQIAVDLEELDLPAGIAGEQQGVANDIDEGFTQLFIAMGASIFIVYLVMVLAFGNASAPFAILFSLPLAVIGGLLGLLLTGESINITSLIGFLMLIGIVVTNAIVLIDRVQQHRGEGSSVRESLIEAGMTRLRPIIMTAGATIIALLPLAFGMAKGSLISKGLAVVVIGGLTTSTLLTLVVVPCMYDIISSFQFRFNRMIGKRVTDKGV